MWQNYRIVNIMNHYNNVFTNYTVVQLTMIKLFFWCYFFCSFYASRVLVRFGCRVSAKLLIIIIRPEIAIFFIILIDK